MDLNFIIDLVIKGNKEELRKDLEKQQLIIDNKNAAKLLQKDHPY